MSGESSAFLAVSELRCAAKKYGESAAHAVVNWT
jgi:hypothetical protein